MVSSNVKKIVFVVVKYANNSYRLCHDVVTCDMFCCDWLVFHSCDWRVSILAVSEIPRVVEREIMENVFKRGSKRANRSCGKPTNNSQSKRRDLYHT